MTGRAASLGSLSLPLFPVAQEASRRRGAPVLLAVREAPHPRVRGPRAMLHAAPLASHHGDSHQGESAMKSLGSLLSFLSVMVLASHGLVAQEKTMQGSAMVRSSQVVGMEVHNSSNQNLGRIEEVVFDRNRGTIAYAV